MTRELKLVVISKEIHGEFNNLEAALICLERTRQRLPYSQVMIDVKEYD